MTRAPRSSTPPDEGLGTKWIAIGAAVGGLALVLLAGGVVGLLWLTVFRGKKPAKPGRDDEEDDDEPRRPAARPAKPAREAKKPPAGGAPDEFPWFG
jgi:hypothetical protein